MAEGPAKPFRELWLSTGDWGHRCLDADGRWWATLDRIQDGMEGDWEECDRPTSNMRSGFRIFRAGKKRRGGLER